MIRKKIAILFILIMLHASYGQELSEAAPIAQLTNVEIDQLLTEISQKSMTITERMNYFSEMFLGVPYADNCTGDGPYALYETEPLVNFQATNCMVFCEHVLALSISDSWDNFFNNLQQIRYRDGVIGIRSRNHYTMADWRPENSWLLEDVSRTIGGENTQTVTRTISHKTFLKGRGVEDLRYVQPDRKISIELVPIRTLLSIKSRIKPGDILVLIFANKTDIFAAHMVMAAGKDGILYIRESSNSRMTTFETDFDDWATEKQKSTRYLGVSILRIRDDLNQPGKIILPWEIFQMRNH